MATQEIAIRRLQQTRKHLRPTAIERTKTLSLVHGPTEPALVDWTLANLLNEQCTTAGDRQCLIVPFSNTNWTFSELRQHARNLAKGLLALGLRRGDRIGIIAGNCEEYVTVFYACGYIGAILVVLNSTYTAAEAKYALNHSGCKLLFFEEKYGRHSNSSLLYQLEEDPEKTPDLETLVMLRGTFNGFPTYEEVRDYISSKATDAQLDAVVETISTHDVCNLQYTSGSTGDPKAAMLTHHNLINNATSIGARMAMGTEDMLCCPPPLFHCFGLVLGLLASHTNSSCLLLPSPTFSAPTILECLQNYPITALHGVPAMFEELLSLPRPKTFNPKHLRTGIVAGAPVPKPLMKQMVEVLGMREFTSSYGLTEASPTCFNAEATETIEKKLITVGKILPHLRAKIVDRDGKTVEIGERGELWMSGYSLTKGYWMNDKKTKEALVQDEEGRTWLKTGDEAVFDEQGYCTITGRFKDIIIRGGENIYPLEIETRLVSHPSKLVTRAAVVGIKHIKYGEVVAAFLLPPLSNPAQSQRPSDNDLRDWVRAVLGRHKAPAHIFWFGDEDVAMAEVPQTGSGKVKKHVLRSVGERLVKERANSKSEKTNEGKERWSEEGITFGLDFNGMDLDEERQREKEQMWSLRKADTFFEYVFDENML